MNDVVFTVATGKKLMMRLGLSIAGLPHHYALRIEIITDTPARAVAMPDQIQEERLGQDVDDVRWWWELGADEGDEDDVEGAEDDGSSGRGGV